MPKTYRLMIYFVTSTLYFYRKSIIPKNEDESLEDFITKNQLVIKRVEEEAINLFSYSLSHKQISTGVYSYLAEAQSVSATMPAKLKEAIETQHN